MSVVVPPLPSARVAVRVSVQVVSTGEGVDEISLVVFRGDIV